MSREKELVKNVFIIAFGTIIPKLLGMVTLPILTAKLTKDEYGIYDLIATLVSLFLPVVTLKIEAAAFRFLIDEREDEKKVKRIITNIIMFILGVSAITLPILYFVLNAVPELIRLLICIYFLLNIVVSAIQQIARGLAKNKLYAVSAAVQALVNMLVIVIAVMKFEQGLAGVLIAAISSFAVALLILVVRLHLWSYFDFRQLSGREIKKMLKYSWPMVPNSLSFWVLNASDRLVLTAFMGVNEVAIYAVANRIPSLFSVVQGTFTMAWQENASLASKDQNSARYYSKVFDDIFRILVGAMALLVAATPLIFKIFIRGDYMAAYYQMPILSMAMLFSTISSFFGGIYVGHKRTTSVGLTTIAAAGVNLVIDLVFVNVIGIYAASVSTLVSYAILAVYRMWNVRKFQPMHYNIGSMILFLTILTVMCGLEFANNPICDIINGGIGVVFAMMINRDFIKKTWKTMRRKIRRTK